jgi:membrane protein DedA with SNARE-associated domain
MSLHMAAMAGAAGSLIGSVAAYWFGARGGRRFFEHYGRYVLVRRRDLDRAEAWFRRYGDAATFFGRMVPVVRAFISLPAGIARMPFGRFALLSFLGSIPWCYLLAYVGIVMGERWQEIKRYFRGADIVVGVLILLGAAFWIWHHLRPEPEESAGPQAAAEPGR